MDNLSPSAQAVLNATDYPEDWATRIRVAAALRAVVEQVLPKDNPSGFVSGVSQAFALQRRTTRRELLAIAAELEGRGNEH